jgi:hypothetical protein
VEKPEDSTVAKMPTKAAPAVQSKTGGSRADRYWQITVSATGSTVYFWFDSQEKVVGRVRTISTS